jgi:hypothetical protein
MRRALAVLLVATVSITVGGCSGINAQTNAYATLAEARQAGAITSGWIPDGLPAGAHDIREGHVPGTSARWGVFEYPQAQEATLRALLQPEEIRPDGQRCDVPARIEWWPVMLRGDLDGSRLGSTGTRVYRATGGNVLFAVNWSQGRAYFWSP